MSMPRPPQLDSAFQQVSAVLAQVAGKPVDLVKDSWADIEQAVIKLLGGPFNPQQQEHQVIALGLAAAMGERLHTEYQAFWFPYRETPEGASLGFPDALIMLAPFGAVVDALGAGKLEKVEEVTKTIRTSLAQAKFGAGGGQPMRLGPEDYMRLFDPGFVQVVGVDPAKLKQAWDSAPERLSIDLRDAINRAPRLPAELKKQLEQQLVGALNRLEGGKPIITQAARAPRVVETVGLLNSATTNTGPAAEEFWQEVVMPLLFVGAPATFPPLGDEELAAAKQGIDPLFLFLDVVPFQFKAAEEGLLGAFTDLQVPAPEFRSSTQVRLIKVGTESVKEALAAFDQVKSRDAIKRFGDHLKEKGGVAAEAKGAQEAKTMLDAAMTLLGELKQAVSGGRDIYVRRMTEAEAASEPALAQVRQALSAPRIILAP
ncbi:MAG: hypothetical protein Q8N23_22485 [Archangium sp.]|nr:hypothetical protein [Archangium sp.]MDP3155457.1 hypothetical protein [Archangium sp.]MDP3573789.1 hypothetical protein [Archangium sp.]